MSQLASGPGHSLYDGIFGASPPVATYGSRNMSAFRDGALGQLNERAYQGGVFATPFNERANRDGALGRYRYGSRQTAYADGVLGNYAYGSQLRAYADGVLGDEETGGGVSQNMLLAGAGVFVLGAAYLLTRKKKMKANRRRRRSRRRR